MVRAALGVGVVPLLLVLHVLHLVTDHFGERKRECTHVDGGGDAREGTVQVYLLCKLYILHIIHTTLLLYRHVFLNGVRI